MSYNRDSSYCQVVYRVSLDGKVFEVTDGTGQLSEVDEGVKEVQVIEPPQFTKDDLNFIKRITLVPSHYKSYGRQVCHLAL